ncbi:hypothetical protein WJX81_002195 [Elliptochloris bilobata]|uniref:Uncharacterized protein n=1 Tax=Elliptochloris bilobata TaxID=381761 RepID=A0AAW1RXD3_9CHLO
MTFEASPAQTEHGQLHILRFLTGFIRGSISQGDITSEELRQVLTAVAPLTADCAACNAAAETGGACSSGRAETWESCPQTSSAARDGTDSAGVSAACGEVRPCIELPAHERLFQCADVWASRRAERQAAAARVHLQAGAAVLGHVQRLPADRLERAGVRMHGGAAETAARLAAQREAALAALRRPALGMSPGSRRLLARGSACFWKRLQDDAARRQAAAAEAALARAARTEAAAAECTGNPRITAAARRLRRSVSDLLLWEERRAQRIAAAFAEKAAAGLG